MADIIGSMSPVEAQIQQQQIDRQRALAMALQQSAMQAPQGQMVSGHYVKSSPLEYVAKIAQALVGKSNQDALDKKQLDVANAQNRFMGDQAAELAKAVTPIAADPGQNFGPGDSQRQASYMEHTGAPAPDMIVGAKPGYNPTQSDLNTAMIKYLTATGNAAKTPDLIIQDAKQRMLVNALMGNGQSGATPSSTPGTSSAPAATGSQGTPGPATIGLPPALEAQLMAVDPTGKLLVEARLKNALATEEMKNNAYMRISGEEAGAAKRAANTKAGIIELQPGTTALNLATGAERFQPKVGEGINLSGGVASALPGYADANAGIEGAKAGAVARANAGYKTQTVNTPGGPRLMTDAQVVDQAGAGQSSPTNFPSVPPDVQRQRDAQAIGIAQQEVASARTPQERQQAQQALDAMVARYNAGQSVITGSAKGDQGAGIPLKSAAREAYDTKLGQDAAVMKSAIDGRVKTGQDLNMRLQESLQALDKFRAGGGAETRADLASKAQAIGLPDNWVKKIAGGDLAAMQEFQKLSVQQAMEQLKSAISNDSGAAGRMTQAEFQIFQKNNPNLSTDPQAIRKIFDFSTKIFNRDLQEQNALSTFVKGGGDPSDFPTYWASELTKRGFTNPSLDAQKSSGGWSIKAIP